MTTCIETAIPPLPVISKRSCAERSTAKTKPLGALDARDARTPTGLVQDANAAACANRA